MTGTPSAASEGADRDGAGRRGTVLHGTGGIWRIRTDDGAELDASLRGRLKQDESRKLAVGDRVVVEPDERGGTAWAIADILPRRSQLVRRAPGSGVMQRVVAANVDQVVVVFAAARPDPHPRMLDRFLVIAEGNQLPARVVINKSELVPEAARRARFADYERAGYPVHFTSARERLGLDELHASLAGRSSVLTGPSGVGKSSLLNSLFPGLNLRVGEISASVNKGRHTTVGGYMHPLPDGGYVVDTPGLREVGLWGLPLEDLDLCFPELRPYRERCRFADCAHLVEPGCAVLEAVAAGAVSRERHESYVKLREELRETEEAY